MAVLVFISIDDFFYAMSINERSNTTSWQPVLWPLRGVIPVACALLFVQGISELLKSLWAARTGEVLVQPREGGWSDWRWWARSMRMARRRRHAASGLRTS